MSLKGDLSTLDLADLLQSLEAHSRSGLLTVEGEHGDALLYFDGGRLALLAEEGRPTLADVLVASGAISAEDLEAAREARKGTRRALGVVLAEQGAIDPDALRAIASARLLDDACELIASADGEFTFTEGKVPRGVFDPEERRLKLGFPAQSLLLEAARRSDHWRGIRDHVPSDTAHYVVTRPPKPVEGEENPLGSALIERLDGTLSIAEVVSAFPHRRFEAYQLLADLVEARHARFVGPVDMARIARERAEADPEGAWQLVARGLDAHPRHHDLLAVQAHLAEQRGDTEAAAEAWKLLAHLAREAGEASIAREALESAKRIAPDDAAVWEKSFELALAGERLDDARADGARLAELLRTPGLHKRAAEVFEKLLERDPTSFDAHKELARSRADCGELEEALASLATFGRDRIAAADDECARRAFEEILALDPVHAEARETIDKIDRDVFALRRRARRRLAQWGAAGLLALIIGALVGVEASARAAFRAASRAVDEQGLLEERRFDEAIARFEDVLERYSWAPTAVDVKARIAALRGRRDG